jgi:hypothetical protein
MHKYTPHVCRNLSLNTLVFSSYTTGIYAVTLTDAIIVLLVRIREKAKTKKQPLATRSTRKMVSLLRECHKVILEM